MKTKKRGKFRNWFDRSEGPSEEKTDSFYLNTRYSVRNRRKLRWPGFGLFSTNSGSGTHGSDSGGQPWTKTVSSLFTMNLILAVGWSSEVSAHAREDSSLKASIALQVVKKFRFLKRTKSVRLQLNGCSDNIKVTIEKRTTGFLRRCCSSIRELSIRDRGASVPESAAASAAGKYDQNRQGDDAGPSLSRLNISWEFQARLKTLPRKFSGVCGATSAWTAIFLLIWALVAQRVSILDLLNFAAARV